MFRVALDTYANEGAPSSEAIAMLIDRQAATVARRIASRWELSERMIGALNDQSAAESTSIGLLSPLGRALLLGRELGALSVLARAGAMPEPEARARALACGAPRLEADLGVARAAATRLRIAPPGPVHGPVARATSVGTAMPGAATGR